MAPLPCFLASPWPLTVGIILLAGARGTKCDSWVLVTMHHRLLIAGGSLPSAEGRYRAGCARPQSS